MDGTHRLNPSLLTPFPARLAAPAYPPQFSDSRLRSETTPGQGRTGIGGAFSRSSRLPGPLPSLSRALPYAFTDSEAEQLLLTKGTNHDGQANTGQRSGIRPEAKGGESHEESDAKRELSTARSSPIFNFQLAIFHPLPPARGGDDAGGDGGDYTLQATSPCIDKGTNQTWMVGAKDLASNTRKIYGGVAGSSGSPVVDMGAYEAPEVPPKSTVIMMR